MKVKRIAKPSARRLLQMEFLERRSLLALTPIFTGRVVDQPVDGVPDFVGPGASAFLNDSFEMRAVAEYDLSSLSSMPSLATLDFVLNVPAGGSGQRQLNLVVYAADGVQALNDFAAPAIAIHPVYYWSSQLSRDYHLDLRDDIASLLQQNATALGIRLEAVGEQSETRLIEPVINIDALPPPTGMRGYASIPSAIAANGQDSFNLEVDAHGDVSSVQLLLSGEWIAEQTNGVVTLHDDGLNGDRIAGDYVYTTPPMRFPATREFSYGFYQRQVDSPAGIEIVDIGTLDITELDGTHTSFLINPQIGLLRSDVPLSPVTQIAPDVQVSNYFVNIATDSSSLQTSLHGNQILTQALLRRLHETFPSGFDFVNLVSTEHIEQRPRLSGRNFVAGQHQNIITDFTGTSRPLADDSASAGGDPRLKGVNYLDTSARGLSGPTVTHELVHQWSAYLDASLGISDGGAHYLFNSSVGSLVGGQEWIANGDGSYTINDRKGRNGATHASPLDLYFMGLLDASAVPPILVFNPNANPPINLFNPHIPASEIIREVTIEDIIAEHGNRTPNVSQSQKDFSIGFVGESSHRLLTQTEMTFYDILAAHYTRPIAADMPTPNNESGWVSVDRFFGHGSSWSSLVPGRTAPSNGAPVAQNAEFFVSETVPPYYVNGGGSIVGRVPVVDPEGNPLAFAIRSGNEDADFIIDHATGDIRVNDQLSAQRRSTYQFEVVIADLGEASKATSATITIHVTGTSSPPSIFVGAAAISYRENAAAPVLISSDATVTDSDSPDFAGGSLTVTLSNNATADDRLSIKHTGDGSGKIGVDYVAQKVRYGGVEIASYTGGVGTSPLVLIFNAAGSIPAAQAALKAITFANVSENPSTAPRTARFVISDGDGGLSTAATRMINVTAVNDKPVVTVTNVSVGYTENAAPIVIDNGILVSDADSADFNTGKLTVKSLSGGQSSDRFGIESSGLISVAGNTVSYSGTPIGTFAGTTTLTVTLNSSANATSVQELARHIVFSNISEAPSATPRQISFTLSDGNGGTSLAALGDIVSITPENDAPVLTLSNAIAAKYTENAAPTLISSGATVVDVDLLNFDTGVLTVALTANGESTDVLSIKHTAPASGKVSVSGNTISYTNGSLVTYAVATFTGGDGTNPLIITFNSSALKTEVQAVMKAITFASSSDNPSTAQRTVSFTLSDGDGGTSNTVVRSVDITLKNDAPVVADFGSAVNYSLAGAPVIITDSATINDVDSVDFNAGKLVVALTANKQTLDRVEIQDGNGITASVGVVSYNGDVIGTYAGTTTLTITFNSAFATPSAVEALLRQLTFRTTSTVTLTRTVTATLYDGDGGASALVSKQVNVA